VLERNVFAAAVEESIDVPDSVTVSVDITSVIDPTVVSLTATGGRRRKKGKISNLRNLDTSQRSLSSSSLSTNVVYFVNFTTLANSVSMMNDYYKDITTSLRSAVAQSGNTSFTYYLQQQAILSNCSAMVYAVSNQVLEISPMMTVTQMQQPTRQSTSFEQGLADSVAKSKVFKGLAAVISVSVVVLVLVGLYFYIKDERANALRLKLKGLKNKLSSKMTDVSIDFYGNRESTGETMTSNPLGYNDVYRGALASTTVTSNPLNNSSAVNSDMFSDLGTQGDAHSTSSASGGFMKNVVSVFSSKPKSNSITPAPAVTVNTDVDRTSRIGDIDDDDDDDSRGTFVGRMKTVLGSMQSKVPPTTPTNTTTISPYDTDRSSRIGDDDIDDSSRVSFRDRIMTVLGSNRSKASPTTTTSTTVNPFAPSVVSDNNL